jgi:hypothetical protein
MAGRLSRVRRVAFLVALVVSAAVYAYSVAGIMDTRSELRSVVSAQSVERSAPVLYQRSTVTHANCPYEGPYQADAPRVEL